MDTNMTAEAIKANNLDKKETKLACSLRLIEIYKVRDEFVVMLQGHFPDLTEFNARCYFNKVGRSVKGAAKTPKAKNIHAESNKLIAKAIKSGAIKVPEFKVTKSPEEIERIRAANLAKMQEITARHKKLKKEYMKGQVADEEAAGHTGVEDFVDEEAKSEVAAILNNQGLISVVPKFLQD